MAWSTGKTGHILMILVDTNVLSAMMRVAIEPAVERWFDTQPPESVWTTTITIFEIRFGLALLAPGHRRDRLYDAFDRAIDEVLSGRVLPFDRTAAEIAAAIAARQRQIGRPVEIRDVQNRRYRGRAQSNPRHAQHPSFRKPWHQSHRSLGRLAAAHWGFGSWP
jgi:toxin FitB